MTDSGARNIDSLLDRQILPVLSRELRVRVADQHTRSGSRRTKFSRDIRLSFSEEGGIAIEFDEATV